MPDQGLLDSYELTDPERAVWWRDRLARVRAEHGCLADASSFD
jgi:O-succinylbenzoate synthase